MSEIIDWPEGVERPTGAELERVQREAEKLVRGLFTYFNDNKVEKGIAVVGLAMITDQLEREGYSVIRAEKKGNA